MRTILSLALAGGLGVLLVACVAQDDTPPQTGAEDFATYCAGCHGTSGRGNGPDAASLARKPADLTQLAARNGGVYPATRVMAKIWGYTGGRGGSPMPAFGPLLDGDTVPYDGGDGILTPTPVRLVQLAEYVKGLQAGG